MELPYYMHFIAGITKKTNVDSIGFSFVHSIEIEAHSVRPQTNIQVVKFCSLRGEGGRGWEGRVKNGVRMKLMITLDWFEFIFC